MVTSFFRGCGGGSLKGSKSTARMIPVVMTAQKQKLGQAPLFIWEPGPFAETGGRPIFSQTKRQFISFSRKKALIMIIVWIL